MPKETSSGRVGVTRTITRTSCFPARLLAPCILAALALSRLLGYSPQLAPPVVFANRAVELRLTGEAGAGYSLEASSNLSNWFLVSTGIAVNGLLTIRHDGASNYSTLFYRAQRPNVSLPPLTVGVKTATNLSVSTMVSLDGGAGILYGSGGMRFTLNLPSNSIPDAQIITMTLVTNITGLPFARGMFGAVLLEPAGLTFWGAASLEITLATNIDRREVVSFFCKGDGSGFQLTPDRVYGDRVVIPVTRSGVFGSSLATTQELANASRIAPAAVQSSNSSGSGSRPKAVLHGPSTTQCFLVKQLRADMVRAEIDAARNAKSRDIAAVLGAERQKQLVGSADDSPSVLANVADTICEFYDAQIAPHWTEAANNCALGEVLIQNTLGLERQRQLLGASEGDGCTALANIPFCPIFQSCLQDVHDCCLSGFKGSAKIAEVLELQRQEQLLGLDCISEPQAQAVIDLCSSNAWTGTFKVLEIGSQFTSSTANGVTVTELYQYKVQFEGAVLESTEFGTPDTGLQVTMNIAGQFAARDLYRRTTSSASGCSSHNTLDQDDRSAALPSNYTFYLITQPDGSYGAFASNVHSTNNIIPPATETDITYDRSTHCDGTVSEVNRTETNPSAFLGTPLGFVSGTMTDSNTVSGTFSGDDTSRTPPTHIEIKWNFKRRTVVP